MHITTSLCCFPVLTKVVGSTTALPATSRWKVLESWVCLLMLPALLVPILQPIFSSLLPLLTLVPTWGWREAWAVRSVNYIMQPCNRSQSFRKLDKLEYVFRFLNSEMFQSKRIRLCPPDSTDVFHFCVPLGCSCHWNTAVYRVCAGQYAGNVRAVGLLLPPWGGESSQAFMFPMPI